MTNGPRCRRRRSAEKRKAVGNGMWWLVLVSSGTHQAVGGCKAQLPPARLDVPKSGPPLIEHSWTGYGRLRQAARGRAGWVNLCGGHHGCCKAEWVSQLPSDGCANVCTLSAARVTPNTTHSFHPSSLTPTGSQSRGACRQSCQQGLTTPSRRPRGRHILRQGPWQSLVRSAGRHRGWGAVRGSFNVFSTRSNAMTPRLLATLQSKPV